MSIRNRIKELRQVRAGDLQSDPRNWRRHPERQQSALQAMLERIGYADALIAREAQDGRLVLIDGHLRAGLDAEQTVPVLVTDLTEAEAGELLATLDPLAAMAETDAVSLDGLLGNLLADEQSAMSQLRDDDLLDDLLAAIGHEALLPPASVGEPDGRIAAGFEGTLLTDRYLEVPISVWDAKRGRWQERKRLWRALLGDAIGRPTDLITESASYDMQFYQRKGQKEKELGRLMSTTEFRDNHWDGRSFPTTSRFDPVLAEVAYTWYSPPGGLVYDPFAGSQERGVVAGMTGRRYVGIDLSGDQVAHNRQIVVDKNLDAVRYIQGDAQQAASLFPDEQADLVFACPPYWNLERYSDDPADLSNMSLDEFLTAHQRVVEACVGKLADDRFAVWVIGDIRGKDGRYLGLPNEVRRHFEAAGVWLHSEQILVRVMGAMAVRVRKPFEAKRSTGLNHEHVLVFCKGDAAKAAQAMGPVEISELSEEPEGSDDE